MIYLANDVVQKDKLHKVTQSYILLKSFEKFLPEASKTIVELGNEEVLETYRRVIQIWRGSKIYKGDVITKLMEIVNKTKAKESKGLADSIVEPYSQLLELKRKKDPIYKELQRFV